MVVATISVLRIQLLGSLGRVHCIWETCSETKAYIKDASSLTSAGFLRKYCDALCLGGALAVLPFEDSPYYEYLDRGRGSRAGDDLREQHQAVG
jgi:hypothetical protein